MQKHKKEEFVRVVKYVLFSASAGVIQFVTFTLLNEIVQWPYWPCYLIALVLSVLWNFTLNREFTFKSTANIPRAMLLVAAYYAVFSPLSTLWGTALTNIGWNEYIVLIGTMLINLTTEFLYWRLVIYRNSINTNARAKRQQTELEETGAVETESEEAAK